MSRGAYAKATGKLNYTREAATALGEIKATALSIKGHKRTWPGKRVLKETIVISRGAIEFKTKSAVDFKPNPRGKSRGKITGFSRKSRKRMMISLANAKTPPEWFQGFTFADDVMEGKTIEERARYAEKVRKAWARSVTHAHPDLVGTWRKEWKPRKCGKLKGELVPHYHMMLSAMRSRENYREFAHDLAIRWVMFTGTEMKYEAFDVAMKPDAAIWMEGEEMLRVYLGKYMAKEEKVTVNDEPQSLGRMWGKIGAWEEEEKETREYGKLQGVTLKRTLKKLAKAQYRRQRAHKKKPGNGKAFVYSRKKGKAVQVNDPWGFHRHQQFLEKIDRGETWMMVKRQTITRLFEYMDSQNIPPF